MPHFLEDLKTDLGNRNFILIIDESNDSFVIKLLSIEIKYYSDIKQKFVLSFLDIIELSECSEDAECDALRICRVITLGTGNAFVMTCINSEVFAKLKAEFLYLLLTECLYYSLQHAVSRAASECLTRNLDFLIKKHITGSLIHLFDKQDILSFTLLEMMARLP